MCTCTFTCTCTCIYVCIYISIINLYSTILHHIKMYLSARPPEPDRRRPAHDADQEARPHGPEGRISSILGYVTITWHVCIYIYIYNYYMLYV